MIDASVKAAAPEPGSGLLAYTHLIYGLHASAVLTGLFSSSTIVGRFLFGLPSLLAVILNYARRAEVRGTWLESHFEWQIRTFWYALLWIAVTLLVGAPLTLILVGVYIVIVGFVIVGLWVAYRVARGWLNLRARRAMTRTMTPAPVAGA
ncbi:MAG TPA: hypothetical protein VGN77_05575 [Steroidobacteraceae bacterium]|nr:hypothetical protein [Steroidobacteraceae bacterium]